jgi:hypothetical protein
LFDHVNRFLTIFDRLKTSLLSIWTYITAYGKSVQDGYKSNAFSPLAWYVFFPIIPLVVIILAIQNKMVLYVCLGLIVLLILFPLVMYVVLLIKDPKLLQSEWYRLEDKRMDMVAKQGDTPTIPELITSVEIKGENVQ